MATAGEKLIDAIQDDIRGLEEQLAEKSRVLSEKKREYNGEVVNIEEARAAAAAAEQRLAIAQEDFRAAEHTKATLLPQFERCQQNKDQHAKAEEFKREIERIEKSMREADSKIKTLEARLQAVSSEYKNERERRSLLADRVASMVDDLRAVIEEKVMLTLPIDESTSVPHASVCVRAIAENAREREVAIAHCARHAAELAAVVQMKQQRVQELRVEADRDIAALKAVKDEQIKRLVLKFDEERRAIQQDIDTVIAANAEQQRQLRNTKLLAAEANTSVSLSADRAVGSSKRAGARGDVTVQVLLKKTKDMEHERDELLAALRKTSAERSTCMNTLRETTAKLQLRDAEHQKSLQAYDNKIQRNNLHASHLERENQKLEEACDVLIATIQAARQAIQASAEPASV